MAYTIKEFLAGCGTITELARQQGWIYGDSHTLPPCNDKPKHLISCDRLPARVLYDMGEKNQQKGGFTVLTIENYLLNEAKGKWKKITRQTDLAAGDIVLMKTKGQSKPTASWHVFVLTAYNSATSICSKYDEGSDQRIQSVQPFKNVPLNEWSNREFYCGFRLIEGPQRIEPKGDAYTFFSAINKSYCMDIKGGSMDNNANIQLHKENSTQAQDFVMQELSNGYVRIVNKRSGLVFDVQSGKVKSGTNIRQHEWNGTKAQQWKMRMNADLTITFESALNEGYVLDVKGGKAANGTNIQLHKYNGTKAQRWTIK